MAGKIEIFELNTNAKKKSIFMAGKIEIFELNTN